MNGRFDARGRPNYSARERLWLHFVQPGHSGGRAPADIAIFQLALRLQIDPAVVRRTDPEVLACAATLGKLTEKGLEEVIRMDARDRRWLVMLAGEWPRIEADRAREEAERAAQLAARKG